LSVLSWGMMSAGIVTLAAGLALVRSRFHAASGADKVIVLGPVFEAAPLAVFAMEHFLDAHDLMQMVPRWLPGHLFWTYFVGACLVAAAISFVAWRCVRWAATLLALLFLIIVATIDLPGLTAHLHERLFWILTVRETAFAAGAMVLAGSVWATRLGAALMQIGRLILAATFVFYAVEHFLFPRNVPGVPLEKMIPGWMPAPVLFASLVGTILLLAGVGLLFRATVRIAAAGSGMMLLLVTALFYVPIFALEFRTPLDVEGLNYIFDTMLFAGTALLAGSGANARRNLNSSAALVP
jgi:uncharacterized membrane protein